MKLTSIIEKTKKILKPEQHVYGIMACKGTGIRGNCYTLMVGPSPKKATAVAQVYEKDENGNPTKDFEKVTILKNESHSIDSYIKNLEKQLKG